MKTSPSKIIKSWLNKVNIRRPKNYLNKYTLSLFFISIFILTILFYFLRPIYFDYQLNKKILENNINSTFKLKMNFAGNISYKVFPSPRILVEDVNLKFIKSSKKNNNKKIIYFNFFFKSSKCQKHSTKKNPC